MAKQRSIGGIYASLSLRDQGFKSGLKNAQKQLANFGRMAMVGAGAGAVAGGAALAAGTKRTLSMVDDLNDVSNQTGIAVGDMMKLQQAYKMGGRAAEMTGKDIGKMQKSIVGAASGGSDPFSAIGLSAKELLDMNPADQFNAIGEAIMRISNPAERTAKAMEIFGKGGMGLATVFEGLPDASIALGKMPMLAQEFAGAMGEANDLIGTLPLKSDQFFVGFTSGIIGQMLPALENINNFDFTNIGESLGTGLGIAIQSVTDGTAWQLFQLQGEKAFAALQQSDAVNGWAASINAMYDGIMSKWGDNYDFGESFDKYADAGKNANKDIIDDLDNQIKEIKNTIFDNYKQAQRTAADKSIKAPIVNPIENLAAKAMQSNAFDSFRLQDRQVNSYQSRGLSLDANGQGRAVETTNSLLTTIRDILKNTQKQGIGNW